MLYVTNAVTHSSHTKKSSLNQMCNNCTYEFKKAEIKPLEWTWMLHGDSWCITAEHYGNAHEPKEGQIVKVIRKNGTIL